MVGLPRRPLGIRLTDDELRAIDDWRFEHRAPNRAEAVRRLLRLGLQATVGTATSPVVGAKRGDPNP
jgi:hypothetical protein